MKFLLSFAFCLLAVTSYAQFTLKHEITIPVEAKPVAQETGWIKKGISHDMQRIILGDSNQVAIEIKTGMLNRENLELAGKVISLGNVCARRLEPNGCNDNGVQNWKKSEDGSLKRKEYFYSNYHPNECFPFIGEFCAGGHFLAKASGLKMNAQISIFSGDKSALLQILDALPEDAGLLQNLVLLEKEETHVLVGICDHKVFIWTEVQPKKMNRDTVGQNK